MIRLLRRHPVREAELSSYVDGRLSAAAGRRVEAHVQTCASCRRSVAGLRSLKSLLSALPSETPRRSFTLTPAQAAREPRSLSTPAPRRPSFMLAPALALTALVLLLGVDLLAFNNDNGRASDATNALFLGQDKAMERSSESAPPAAAPSLRNATPETAAGAGAADSAQPTPAAATRQTEGPSLTAPTTTAPEARTPTDTSAARGGPKDNDEGRSVLRALEIVAAGALVLSLGYLFWQARRSAGE